MKLKRLKIKSFITELTGEETQRLNGGKVQETLVETECMQIQNPIDGGEGDPHDLGGGMRGPQKPA